jgi:thiosulfate/3-mercaptopyruvate sulfurtransferase
MTADTNSPHSPHRFLWITGILIALVAHIGHSRAMGVEPQPPGDEHFMLVSPQWLSKHASDPDLRILDVRPDVHHYLAGHVPGAIYLADAAMRAPKGGLPVQCLDPEVMAVVFRHANIGDQQLVAVYSDGDDVLGATLIAYCLHRLGHTKTCILDGGYQAYAKSQKTTQAYPDCAPGNLKECLDRSVFVTLDELLTGMKASNVVLVDARPARAYAGDITTWMRNGHIPGALNLDWHQLVQPEDRHRFKPVEEMRKIVERSGIKKHDDLVVYCGTGREATLLYMVMKHVLGYPKVRLYEGSWTEYCAHKDLPIAKGMEPGKAGRSGERQEISHHER